jgi:hypothetical protein
MSKAALLSIQGELAIQILQVAEETLKRVGSRIDKLPASSEIGTYVAEIQSDLLDNVGSWRDVGIRGASSLLDDLRAIMENGAHLRSYAKMTGESPEANRKRQQNMLTDQAAKIHAFLTKTRRDYTRQWRAPLEKWRLDR